jgi:hypothetical protein
MAWRGAVEGGGEGKGRRRGASKCIIKKGRAHLIREEAVRTRATPKEDDDEVAKQNGI